MSKSYYYLNLWNTTNASTKKINITGIKRKSKILMFPSVTTSFVPVSPRNKFPKKITAKPIIANIKTAIATLKARPI